MFGQPDVVRHCAQREAQSNRRRHRVLWSFVAAIATLTLVVSIVLADNTVTIDGDVSDWSDELCRNDQHIDGGSTYYDDANNQYDATKFCAASNHDSLQPDPLDNANTLYVMWHWDDTDFSHPRDGVGCALFDTDTTPAQRGNIDYALCNTISTNGTTTIAIKLYSCDDSKPDRCAGDTESTFTGSCQLDENATDPWSSRSSPDCNGTDCGTTDMAVECSVPLTDLGLSAGDVLLLGFSTFPSGNPGSTPRDCTLDPAASRFGIDTDTGSNQEVSPTAITLASFTATGYDGYVLLEWETASEIDNDGFNLWRSEAEAGPYSKLNADLIPAQGGPTFGASYSYDDEAVTNGVTYWYKLEDVDLYGVSTFHGPVAATPQRLHWLYLSLLLKGGHP